MTPRQLHALEWATRVCRTELRICFKEHWEESETKRKCDEADRAMAQLWHDYREQQSAARIKPARRDLQTVPR